MQTAVGGGRRFVIAGGPGTGKSSLLEALSAVGEICYPEVSRQLIREQHASGGRLLPWGDLRGFARRCAARMLEDLASSPTDSRCFFDRGLPDLIGYLTHAGEVPPPEWRDLSRAYERTVFVAPSWRDIYIQDAERPQTFDEARSLGQHVRQAYVDCGFTIIDLVAGTVEERLLQVSRHRAAIPAVPPAAFTRFA